MRLGFGGVEYRDNGYRGGEGVDEYHGGGKNRWILPN